MYLFMDLFILNQICLIVYTYHPFTSETLHNPPKEGRGYTAEFPRNTFLSSYCDSWSKVYPRSSLYLIANKNTYHTSDF